MSVEQVKAIARLMLPPILLQLARRARRSGRVVPEWEYAPRGWETETASPVGWESPGVVESQKSRWAALRRAVDAPQPLGFNIEDPNPSNRDIIVHNAVMSFAYVLTRSLGPRGSLSILDWGGGLGHYFVYSRTLFPESAMQYSCRELPLACATGRRLLPRGRLLRGRLLP